MITHIDAALLKKMFLSGAAALDEKKELINELNVFPVPDGDTGTNMTMTIMSAANAINALENLDFINFSEALSTGSLKGARGNSGVILSQILRGISKVIKKSDVVDVTVMAAAFQKGSDTAYKAVMKPKEGTILTVIKAVADVSGELSVHMEDMEEFFVRLTEHAKRVLDRTPEMLPVLKEAGVVDSGGMGLLTVLNGMLQALQGREVSFDWSAYNMKPRLPKRPMEEFAEDIEFGYCTEMIIMLNEKVAGPRLNDFKEFLESVGNSVVFVPDTEMIKLHVHTNDPGRVLSKAIGFGELSNIKIDNMREEHRELVFSSSDYTKADEKAGEETEQKEIGFIAISSGEGFEALFKELGADEVIEGGQTMNPSTGDILSMIERVNARNIFVFPNNKNIILACNQARDLTKDKAVIVIPSLTVPQGIAAMMSYLGDDSDVDTVKEEMYAAIASVKSFALTYSIRNTEIDGCQIKKGDIMVLSEQGLVTAADAILSALKELLETQVDQTVSYITFYQGKEVDEQLSEAVKNLVSDILPDLEVDFNYGGQEIYYYIISME